MAEQAGVCSDRGRGPGETSSAPCLLITELCLRCPEECPIAHAERTEHKCACAAKAARRANHRNPGYQTGRTPDAQRQYAKLAQPAAKGICSDLSSLRSQAERSTVQHAGASGSRGDWAGSSRTQNGQPGHERRGCEALAQGSHNYMQRRGESKVSKFALICFSIYHLHVVSGIKRE